MNKCKYLVLILSKGSCAWGAESQTLTAGFAAKWGFICREPSQENRKLMLQWPDLPHGFQTRVFKHRVRGEGRRKLISLWTFFWFVGGEATGWCLRNHNLLVPTSLGSSACGQHVVPSSLHLGGSLSFYRTTQRYASDCYLSALRRH